MGTSVFDTQLPRFSTPVCLAMLLAIVFELNYRTESESEQEDDAYNLVDSIAKAV